jgi:hypothetical protein
MDDFAVAKTLLFAGSELLSFPFYYVRPSAGVAEPSNPSSLS